MKILVTGFEPFDGETVNPALEAVKGLPERIGDAEIVKAEIPVVFGRAGEKLAEAVAACTPDIVLCIGQAGRRVRHLCGADRGQSHRRQDCGQRWETAGGRTGQRGRRKRLLRVRACEGHGAGPCSRAAYRPSCRFPQAALSATRLCMNCCIS